MPLDTPDRAGSDGPEVPDWARDVRAPAHELHEIEALVKDRYGLEGQLHPLDGERDQNILISTGDARRWVVKISEGAAAEATADYQAALLGYLEGAAPDLPLPRNRTDRTGAPYLLHRFANGQPAAVRVVSYLEGRPLSDLPPSHGSWARPIGAFQGRLCRALRGFEHPQSTRFMPWDSSSDVMLDDRMLAFLDPDFRTAVTPHLNRLTDAVLPALRDAPAQVIHNDIHPGNILLDDGGRVAGMIDFGDAIHRSALQDLAVSVTSLIEFAPDRTEHVIPQLIGGFLAHCPLSSQMLALLYDAILLRGILSVALGRMKDRGVPPAMRPRPATRLSEGGLRAILSLSGGVLSDPQRLQRLADG